MKESSRFYLEKLYTATEVLQDCFGDPPIWLVILGSGLRTDGEGYEELHCLRYDEIPGFLPPSVEGHEGILSLGTLHGTKICLMKGRPHYYEGHSLADVVFPVRALALWGVSTFVLTNAAGGIRADLTPGQMMLIDDHLNLMGASPLRGEALPELGEPFPDMTRCYDPKLGAELIRIAGELSVSLSRGVYAAVSGPQLETHSEIRMLATLGADAVGMSTVPESIALNQMKKRVLALSCITNRAAGLADEVLSHTEIVRQAELGSKHLWSLISELVREGDE